MRYSRSRSQSTNQSCRWSRESKKIMWPSSSNMGQCHHWKGEGKDTGQDQQCLIFARNSSKTRRHRRTTGRGKQHRGKSIRDMQRNVSVRLKMRTTCWSTMKWIAWTRNGVECLSSRRLEWNTDPIETAELVNQIGQDCTVPAQWWGESRIRRNSRSRTSRSVTKCRSEGGTTKRKNTKQMLAEAESTNPGRDTACDVSSFHPSGVMKRCLQWMKSVAVEPCRWSSSAKPTAEARDEPDEDDSKQH